MFLCGMEEGLFPHQRSLESHAQLEEERRLCYVGMTRAKQRLCLTNAESRRLHRMESYPSPSRFLREVPPELVEEVRLGGHRPSPAGRRRATLGFPRRRKMGWRWVRRRGSGGERNRGQRRPCLRARPTRAPRQVRGRSGPQPRRRWRARPRSRQLRGGGREVAGRRLCEPRSHLTPPSRPITARRRRFARPGSRRIVASHGPRRAHALARGANDRRRRGPRCRPRCADRTHLKEKPHVDRPRRCRDHRQAGASRPGSRRVPGQRSGRPCRGRVHRVRCDRRCR